jgi:hypothetical protein
MRECPKEEAMPSSRPKRRRVWVISKTLGPREKAAIGATCDRFIGDVLKLKFLPEIKPTEFNYPIDILGKWRDGNYSFIDERSNGGRNGPKASIAPSSRQVESGCTYPTRAKTAPGFECGLRREVHRIPPIRALTEALRVLTIVRILSLKLSR